MYLHTGVFTSQWWHEFKSLPNTHITYFLNINFIFPYYPAGYIFNPSPKDKYSVMSPWTFITSLVTSFLNIQLELSQKYFM